MWTKQVRSPKKPSLPRDEGLEPASRTPQSTWLPIPSPMDLMVVDDSAWAGSLSRHTLSCQDHVIIKNYHARTTVIIKNMARKKGWACHSDSPDLARHTGSYTWLASAGAGLLSHQKHWSPIRWLSCPLLGLVVSTPCS